MEIDYNRVLVVDTPGRRCGRNPLKIKKKSCCFEVTRDCQCYLQQVFYVNLQYDVFGLADVARTVTKGTETQTQNKIAIFAVCNEPDIAVFFLVSIFRSGVYNCKLFGGAFVVQRIAGRRKGKSYLGEIK